MEKITGWVVVAFTEDTKQIWASVDIKGIASGNRAINVIPVLTNELDANLVASHCWEQNDNIKHIGIVDISSLFNKNKPILRLIHEKMDTTKKKKSWWKFWRK